MNNKYVQSKTCNVCKICGEQIQLGKSFTLTCIICSSKSHLNCEQLSHEEYIVFNNPTKHPNIIWKCINCTMPNVQNISNLENLIELMFSQLKDLHSKVDYLCKNQQNFSSLIHQNHNDLNKKLYNNEYNYLIPNPHNHYNLDQQNNLKSNTDSFGQITNNDIPYYSQNYNAEEPKWNRFMPCSPILNTNIKNDYRTLPINRNENFYNPTTSHENSKYVDFVNDKLQNYFNLECQNIVGSNNQNFVNNNMFNNKNLDENINYQDNLHDSLKNHYNKKISSIDTNKENKYSDFESQSLAKTCNNITFNNNSSNAINDPISKEISSNCPSLKTCEQNFYTSNPMTNHLLPEIETVLEHEFNYNVTIKPPEIPNKEYLLCVLSHIESPSEFYVHVTDESTSNPVDDISEQLSSFYSKSQYPIIYSENLKSLKNKFFAALYTSDENWYRVRVLEVYDDLTLLVQYIDYGNTETIPIENLNYLKPELAEIPILAVKCSLSHIKPTEKEWTLEQNYFFKNISGYDQEKIVTAYITSTPNLINYDSSIEVFLWNNDVQLDGLRMDCGKDILINSLMVEIGIAKTDDYDWIEEAEKKCKDCPETIALENSPLEVDLKTKVLPSAETAVNVDIDNLKTNDADLGSINSIVKNDEKLTTYETTSTTKKQSFESECSFDTDALDEVRFLTDQSLNENTNLDDNQSEKMIEPYVLKDSNIKTSDSFNETNLDNLEETINQTDFYQIKKYPLNNLISGMTVFIKITAIRDPHCFYGVLPFGTIPYENINADTAKQLMEKLKTAPEFLKYKELSNKMKSHYNKPNIKEQFKIPPRIGELVAVKEDLNVFRAKIIEINLENETYQLQCIDTGKISIIEKNNIFKLKNEFLELPEFSVQYSMPNIEPFNCNLVNQRKCAWSESAKKAFIDFTFGNVFLANILDVINCNNILDKETINDNQKVLVDLLNIFEEQENVDDFMINNKLAQLVIKENLDDELSSKLNIDNLMNKDDNNNKLKKETEKSIIENKTSTIEKTDKLKNNDNIVNESIK